MRKPHAVGKSLTSHTYIHKSNTRNLPDDKRMMLAMALIIAGEFDYDIAKIAHDGTHVCLLRYPTFNTDAHPALKYSIKVMLEQKQLCITDYSTHTNPPILHRKEALVGSNYPFYRKFRKLTKAEEGYGLLSRSDIGNRNQWAALLKSRNLMIRGHSLSEH